MSLLQVRVEPAGAAAADSAPEILSGDYLELMAKFKKNIVQGSGKAEAIAGGEHVVWKLNEWVWRLGVRPAEVYSWSRDGVALQLSDPREKRKRAVSILNYMQKNAKELATAGITPPSASLEYLYLCRAEALTEPCDPAGELAQVRKLEELLLKLQQRHAADDVAKLLQWFRQLCDYAKEGKSACVVTLERMSCLGPDLLDELDGLRRSYLRGKGRSENKNRLRGILSQVSRAIARFVLVASGEADMPWRVSADTKPENFVTVPRDFEAGHTSVAAIRLVDVDCFYHEGEVKRASLEAPELFTLGKRLHVYPLPSELRKIQNAAALVVMHFLMFVCNWLRESGFESNRALRQDIFCEQSCPGLGDQATIVRGLELLGQIDRHYQTARVQGLTLIAGLTWTIQQHHSELFTACCPVGTGRLYTCSYNYRLLSRLVTCGVCHKQSAGGALLGALNEFYSTVVQQSELRQVVRKSTGAGEGRKAPAPEHGGGSPLDSWGAPYDPTEPEAEVAVLFDQGAVAPVPTALTNKSAVRVGDLLTPDRIDNLNITTQLRLGMRAKAAEELQKDKMSYGSEVKGIYANLDKETACIDALLKKQIHEFTEEDIQTLVASINILRGWLETIIREVDRCKQEEARDEKAASNLMGQSRADQELRSDRTQRLELCTQIKETIEAKLLAWEKDDLWQKALCWEPFTLYCLYLLFQDLRRVAPGAEPPALYKDWRLRAGHALANLSYHILPLPSRPFFLPHADAQGYMSTDDLQKRFGSAKNIFSNPDSVCLQLSKSMLEIQDFVQAQISNQSSSLKLSVSKNNPAITLPACVQTHYDKLKAQWAAADPERNPPTKPHLLWTEGHQESSSSRFARLDCLYQHELPAAGSTKPKLCALRTCKCAENKEPSFQSENSKASCVHVLFLQAFLCTKFVEACAEMRPQHSNNLTQRPNIWSDFHHQRRLLIIHAHK